MFIWKLTFKKKKKYGKSLSANKILKKSYILGGEIHHSCCCFPLGERLPDNYFLTTKCVPDSVLGAGNTRVKDRQGPL